MKKILATLTNVLLLVRFFSVVCVLGAVATAQFTLRSSLTGMVRDISQSVVPHAKVTLTDVDRSFSQQTTTNDEGVYTFTDLTPGRYEVSVEHAGFRKAVSGVITIVSKQNARFDFSLALGEFTEAVTVTSAVPLVQLSENVIGQVVDRRYIETLPVKGRNFTTFANLQTNVSTFPRPNSGETWTAGTHHAVSGSDVAVPGNVGTFGFYVNGANVNDMYTGSVSYQPSMESISEVRVDSANFSAENGRDISSFSAVTRGGIASYHGAVYDYLQNSALNAWDPLTKARAAPGQEKSQLKRNQYGGNFGGPLLGKKVFFFGNYEGFDERGGGTAAIYRVPTLAERQGDYSALLSRFPGDPNFILYDPFSTVVNAQGNTTRTPVPNNDLRSIGINSQAQQIIDGMYPQPNGYQNPSDPRDLSNYRTFSGNHLTAWRVDSRFDFRPTQKDNFYVSYARSHGRDDKKGGLFPEYPANVDDLSYYLTVNYSRVFRPNLTNEFYFSNSPVEFQTIDPATTARAQDPTTIRNRLFKNIGERENLGFHGIVLPGYDNIGVGGAFLRNKGYQFANNISWIRGRHTLKGGLNYLAKGIRNTGTGNRGVTFDPTFTRSGSVAGSRGGDSMASFLLGLPTQIVQYPEFTGGVPYPDVEAPYWGWFVEDKWKVSPKLTLSLGLRHDIGLPSFDVGSYGFATIDFSVPGWQLAIPGRAPNLDHHYASADLNNLAPRIGIAYKLRDDIVVRTSYGIFYEAGTTTTASWIVDESSETVPGGVLSQDVINNARFGVNDDVVLLRFSDIWPAQQKVQVGTYPVSTGTGTGRFNGISNVTYTDANSWKLPYQQRYMLEVQKQFGQSTVLSVSYLGSRASQLRYKENINKPAYRTGWPSAAVVNQNRPNNVGYFGDVWLMRNGINSFYNAATIKFERRMAAGLQILSHYTFSKTVTDPEQYVTGGRQRFQFDYNRRLGRGESSQSHPHRWFTAFTYETPWGKSMPRAAQFLLAGWTVSGMVNFESGDALSVVNRVTSARDREPNFPNVVANPNLSHGERSFYRFFNTSAFSTPPQDVKGTAGVGIVRGPGQNNWDIALGKIFKVTEKVKAEFRSDLLNAFNHTQWANVNTNYTDAANSTFGWVNAAREPRVVQLALRVYF